MNQVVEVIPCGQDSAALGPFEIPVKEGCCGIQLRLPASLSRMFNVFHVSLLERYKDQDRRPAPPAVVLDDGEIECKIDKILQDWSQVIQCAMDRPVSRGNEWLTKSKLKNASDFVQDYLDELINKGRQAARVGRPDSAAAQADSAVSDSGTTDSQDTVLAKLK